MNEITECNVCFKNYKKLNKCCKCSFMICDICITKLSVLSFSSDTIQYNCCVCKYNNFLKLKDIKQIKVLKLLYSRQHNIIQLHQEDPVSISSIILIYNAPVISNNNVSYFGSNIIALKTQYDNHYNTIELYDKIHPLIASYNLNYFSYIPQVDYHFLYSSTEYNFTLLPNKDFYKLINDTLIDFV